METIYLKRIDNYNEINKYKFRFANIFIKLIFLYKNIFNIITKIQKDGFNIWILPYKEKISENKFEKILNKQLKKGKLSKEHKILLANNLNLSNPNYILDKKEIRYYDGKLIRKMLVCYTIEYINKIQEKEMKDREIAILVDEDTQINNYLIFKLAMITKSLKIVSKKIYKFKGIEEKLYNEYGIAIQFSNMYKKSLLKSDIIVNLDFSEIEINEYNINQSAIIINTENPIKIKSKLFNGIVANSISIKFSKEINSIFQKKLLLYRYDNLLLYESIINWKTNYSEIDEKIKNDNVRVLNLIGNNGIITKREIEIVK